MTMMERFTYRQKAVAVRLALTVATMAAFGVYLALYRGNRLYAGIFLWVVWIGPVLYDAWEIQSAGDKRTDERDTQVELAGVRNGYAVLSFSVVMLVWMDERNSHTLLNELFAAYLLSLLVRDWKKMRLYAGHRGFLPDSFGDRIRARSRERFERRLAEAKARRIEPDGEGGA